MVLDDYLRALRRWWWAPLICAGLAVAASLAVAAGAPWRSEARVAVGAAPDLPAADARDAAESIDAQTLNTLADVFTSSEVLSAAARQAGVEEADVDGYRIAATVGPLSQSVTVSVEGPDPDAAQRVAAAVVAEGPFVFGELQDIYRVRALDPAGEAERAGPSVAARAGVAAVAGLTAGALLAFAREWLALRRGVERPAPTAS